MTTDLSNAYCTIEELKGHLISSNGIDSVRVTNFSLDDDELLNVAIQSASEYLDDYFNTTFYAITETRYFTPTMQDLLYIDDLISLTTLKTDDDGDRTYETTWATTDYWLEPTNANTRRKPKPYRQIRIDNDNGNYVFPINVRNGVEITGQWGYCTEANRPMQIKQAVLLLAHRWFKRKDSIYGVEGSPQLGAQTIQMQMKMDDDILALLNSISKRGGYYV